MSDNEIKLREGTSVIHGHSCFCFHVIGINRDNHVLNAAYAVIYHVVMKVSRKEVIHRSTFHGLHRQFYLSGECTPRILGSCRVKQNVSPHSSIFTMKFTMKFTMQIYEVTNDMQNKVRGRVEELICHPQDVVCYDRLNCQYECQK